MDEMLDFLGKHELPKLTQAKIYIQIIKENMEEIENTFEKLTLLMVAGAGGFLWESYQCSKEHIISLLFKLSE